MSTKIYNGYRMPTTDLFTLLNQCQEIRLKLEERRNSVLKTQSRNKAEYSAWRYKIQKQIDESDRKGHQHLHDYSVEICFLPTEHSYLYLTFPAKSRSMDIIQDHFKSEFFGYWNNVDPDEDCSEVSWQERKRLWDEALLKGKNGIPGQPGFTITLLDTRLSMLDELYKGGQGE